MPEELRLSVSKVKTYSQCHKQFQFNYILKFPKKERDYHILGKFCHRVLEWFHLQYMEECLLPYHIVMKDAFTVAWKEFGDKMTPEMKQEAWTMIDQYLQIITKDKKDGKIFNILSAERQFAFNLTDDIVLNGAIDVVKMDDDGILHIADYKTSKQKKYLQNDWLQLKSYSYVILSERPELEKIRASYIMLRHNFEYITTEFFKDDILTIKEQFEKYAQMIRNEKEYLPTTSKLCGYCDFLEFCPEGKAVVGDDFRQQQKVFGEVSW